MNPVGMKQNRTAFPLYTPVGMSYVPFQQIGMIYEPKRALKVGTVFPDLDKPWLDGKAAAMMTSENTAPAIMETELPKNDDTMKGEI